MKQVIKKLNIVKNEWLFILSLSIVMILISTIPFIYAVFTAQNGYVYNGLQTMTPGDMSVYYSYIEQVKQGNYLFENLFTGEKTIKVLNIFWLGVGLLAKLFNLNAIVAFHLSKILLIPICLTSLYLLISYFFDSKKYRQITLLFLVFSSGVGAIASIVIPSYITNETLLYWPMDLWVAEFNTFLTLYHSPHLIASLTLIVLTFLFFLIAIDTNKVKYSLLAGMSGLLLIQFHPFHLPTIWVIPAMYLFFLSIFNKKINFDHVKHYLILILISSPSVAYYFWLINIDWATRLKSSQNYCYTPSFITVTISYGGLLLISTLTSIIWLKKSVFKKIDKTKPLTELLSNNKILFIVTWFTVQFALIFSPVIFQRRLSEGLQIPMVLLTVIGVIWLKKYFEENFKYLEINKILFNRYLLVIVFIIFFSASNWIVVQEDIKMFQENYWLFYDKIDQKKSYLWIKDNLKEEDVIIASMPNGNFIPGVSGKKVYFGHINVETLYYDSKLARLKWFYKDNTSDDKKIDFLKKNNIKYIYHSEYEKELGDYNPAEKIYLEKQFNNTFATIYKVL